MIPEPALILNAEDIGTVAAGGHDRTYYVRYPETVRIIEDSTVNALRAVGI